LDIDQMVDDTVKSGIAPIVFDCQDVVFFHRNTHLLRTFVVINSLELGMLTTREYRYVARRTRQGDYLVQRHIERIVRLLPELVRQDPSVECFTVPVYAKLLKDGVLARMIFDAFTVYTDASPAKLCIELSADILYEDMDESRARIEELRNMGVKVAICEVGDEFCPVFRLASLPFDYAFIDEYSTKTLDRDDAERVAGSLVKFLHYLGAQVVAPSLWNDDMIAGAKAVECDGYSISDKPVSEGAAEAAAAFFADDEEESEEDEAAEATEVTEEAETTDAPEAESEAAEAEAPKEEEPQPKQKARKPFRISSVFGLNRREVIGEEADES
jgi:EAL domain-containing protein (putative c-di-GMP-specific phosphodiesterase class I)